MRKLLAERKLKDAREYFESLGSDLEKSVKFFLELEERLEADKGAFILWVRLCAEQDGDFEIMYYEFAETYYDGFLRLEADYGKEIARRMFNTESCLLPEEFEMAAEYLIAGGREQDLKSISEYCFFEEKASPDALKTLAKQINKGENIKDSIELITESYKCWINNCFLNEELMLDKVKYE